MKAQQPQEKRKWEDIVLDGLGLMRFALIFFLLLYGFMMIVLRPEVVAGTSMTPTLLEGDRGFINVAANLFFDIERFDVVAVVEPQSQEQWVKRVIGLPGETISYQNGVLNIDGVTVEEPFLEASYIASVGYTKATFTSDFDAITLQEGEYFLMGDNRIDSYDSRARGPFQRSDIIAKHFYSFWPKMKVVQ